MKEKEKIVLVAGTFDILHESHINMLRNARNLGDRLVVMLSTDEFNETKEREPIKNMIRVSMFWKPSGM